MVPLENQFLWVAIIAGGQGTRLFPLSHDNCPKQFCHQDNNNTFIQATIKRFVEIGVVPSHIVLVTTNENQTKLAKEQTSLLGILSQNIIEISPAYGYAGAMIKASMFIKKLDKHAVVINSPADQYIVSDDNFKQTIKDAIESASGGSPTIVGVKVTDLVTVMGCGHAIYDPKEDAVCRKVCGFVEKPDEKQATKLMRGDNSACNTGINVWKADLVAKLFAGKDLIGEALSTDELMAKFENLRLAIGTFRWLDCGTLKSFYEISAKTPNHKNASLGKGEIDRTDCRRSLFYAVDGIKLHVAGIEDSAVLATVIDDRIVIVSVKLEESQKVRNLAEDYKANKDFLTDDFSVGARNNWTMRTNCSSEIRVGFVGVDNFIVYSHKNIDGTFDVAVSQQ